MSPIYILDFVVEKLNQSTKRKEYVRKYRTFVHMKIDNCFVNDFRQDPTNQVD